MKREDEELNNERNHVNMSMLAWVVALFVLVFLAFVFVNETFAQVVVTRPPVACTTVCDQGTGLCTTLCN